MRTGKILAGTALTILLTAPPARAEAEREIERSFDLAPGAEVELGGFNGRLEIETGEGSEAFVSIHRRADAESDFDARPVILETNGNRLVVRVESDRGSSRSVRDDVFIRLPDSVATLDIGGVNGKVESGFIQGSTRVHGINGPVRLAQAGGRLEVKGVNGSIDVEMGAPVAEGVHFEGINGSIQMIVPPGAGFEVEARSKNGKVHLDVPDTTVELDQRNRFRAVVGSGGPSVSFQGVNGRIEIRN